MGEYTAFKKFYKPEKTELVDVDAHLNYNLDIMDAESLPIFGYVYTNEQNITTSALKKQAGYHWYKTWSNSVWFYGTQAVQDGTCNVPDWNILTNIINGWEAASDAGQDQRLRYRILSGASSNKNIQWQGVLVFPFNNIPVKTWSRFAIAPVAARPAITHYSCVFGASDLTYFIQGMFRIDPDGSMYFGLNGDNNGSPVSNAYISLAGVQYAIL